jgi:Tfp pilus assembly protein PilF
MLKAFEDTEKADEGHWLAWTCALAPEALADLSAAVAEGQMAVQSAPESVVYLNTLGAILYRAGRFEEAVQRPTEADKLTEKPDTAARSSPAYTWYFWAMAHHKLGHEAEAKEWLDKATAWTAKVLGEHEEGTAPLAWNRRLTLKLFREEAEELIGKGEK